MKIAETVNENLLEMDTKENPKEESIIKQDVVSHEPLPLTSNENSTTDAATKTNVPQTEEKNAIVEDNDRKEKEDDKADTEPPPSSTTEKGDCSTSRETNLLLVDLSENEKTTLLEFRSMVEEAILLKKMYKEKENSKTENNPTKEEPKAKPSIHIGPKDQDQDQVSNKGLEEKTENQEPVEIKEVGNEDCNKDKGKEIVAEEDQGDKVVEVNPKKPSEAEEIFLWGVPLLPSKGDERTNVILIKFLRARDFKPNDAFDMLRNTLQWRLENNIDSILQEDLGFDFLDSVAFIDGVDREGHLVCYNMYGIFANEELYNKTFGNTESKEKFLRWRVQLMEKQIQKLDFSPGGLSSLLQINDLKETLGPTRKDIRMAIRKVVELLQDNYPEFVVRNVFINVPFWYYAVNTVWYPFLTQRTKSKIVFARPTKVTEILLKYIVVEEIPTKYGGLKRENDDEFTTKDVVSEVVVNASTNQTIEIPAPEVGRRIVWDLTIVGWEVTYKEEFVPTDEKSYALIVKRSKNLTLQEEPIRNSFQTKEPGKLVFTIENGIFKKKRVFFRYKTTDIVSDT